MFDSRRKKDLKTQRVGSLNRFVSERPITVPVVLVLATAAGGPLTGQSASTLGATPWILPGNESWTSGQQQIGSPARHDGSGSVGPGCRCPAGSRRGIPAGSGASGRRPARTAVTGPSCALCCSCQFQRQELHPTDHSPVFIKLYWLLLQTENAADRFDLLWPIFFFLLCI